MSLDEVERISIQLQSGNDRVRAATLMDRDAIGSRKAAFLTLKRVVLPACHGIGLNPFDMGRLPALRTGDPRSRDGRRRLHKPCHAIPSQFGQA
jgi:hypothetical protein